MSERAIEAAGLIEQMCEALRPFAAFCEKAEAFVDARAKDSGSPILPSTDFRLSDFRKARAALAAAQRVATDEYAPEFVEQILQLEAMPPEATFNNADDMLKWLDEDTAAAQRVEAPDTSYAEVSTEQIRRMNEHAAAQRAAGEWKCFHCDEVFTDREVAERHFGTRQYDAPLCVADQFELVSTRKERDEYGDLCARTVGDLLKAQERIARLEAALALSPGKGEGWNEAIDASVNCVAGFESKGVQPIIDELISLKRGDDHGRR